MATNKTARARKPTTTAVAPALADDDTPPTAPGNGEHAALVRGVDNDGRGASPSTLADGVGDVIAGTARVAQAVVPNRAPLYLGMAALLVLGALDPPLVLASALAYEALRRWSPHGRAGASWPRPMSNMWPNRGTQNDERYSAHV